MTDQIDTVDVSNDLLALLVTMRQVAHRYGLSQAEYSLLFAVVEAAERAGPWPRIDATAIGKCFDCFWPTWEQGHDPNCKGLAVRDALAALTAHLRGER